MKRIISFLLVTVMLIGLLSGCRQIPTDNTPDITEPQAPTDSVADPTAEPEKANNIVINEVMSDNERLCMGHDLDWIELQNSEEFAVSLEDYYLTDNMDHPHAFHLQGLEIPAEGYLVITLNDDAPFKLSSSGESVYLVCGNTAISQLSFPETTKGEAVDVNGICEYPTPGFANTEAGYHWRYPT